MIDYLFENEANIRLSVFLGGFAVLACIEIVFPRRDLSVSKAGRWMNNFSLTVLNTILLRLLVPAAAVGAAVLVEQNQWGVTNLLQWPFALQAVVTFIILDFAIYIQHMLFHVVPLLWRFHRVHHSDLDCDVTTGLRFHPVEIIISIGIKLLVIVTIGAPVVTVIVFEIVLNFMSMFTHSNIRLSSYFDRFMRWFFVTPDMHRVHHSAQENETNSNFGFFVSIWDRLLGTYVKTPELGYEKMVVGLDQFREQQWQGVAGLLYMPFTTHVGGYAINYRDARNEKGLAIAREIAEQNQEKARLAIELDSYIRAIDQHALVSVTDSGGVITSVNAMFCEISGYTEEELLGNTHRIVNSGFHPPEFFQQLWQTICEGKKWQGEICNRAKNGDLYWVDCTIVPIVDNSGTVDRYVSVRINITDRKNNEERLQSTNNELTNANTQLELLSRIDGLTGVANRRYFDETIRAEVSKLSRLSLPITLMICDIDHFKNYNDNHGHLAGDECLKQVSKAIKDSFYRDSDFVARYGGEEFVVIISNVSKEDSISIANRTRQKVEGLGILHTGMKDSRTVTVSIGVTTMIPDRDTRIEQIIKNADEALYQAKNEGRNKVVFKGPEH